MNIIHEGAQFGEISVQKKNLDTLEFITVLQEADAPNRNGRVYPKAVLEKALNAPNIRERLATNTWYGEANHPLDNSVQRQMTIDLRNVAFLIKEIWWEGNILKGRCETANTSVGRDMKGLIEQGCRVAFSLRAQGNVHTNPATGLVEVEDGLQILGYDWIQVPSHSKAFMEKICEATIMAMYRTTKGNLNSQILCESEDLFLNGDMFDPSDVVSPTELDYTKNYTPKFKKVEDMYVPEDGDTVSSMDINNVLITNESKNVVKKVLTEDFIVKDIRSKLMSLTEAKKCPKCGGLLADSGECNACDNVWIDERDQRERKNLDEEKGPELDSKSSELENVATEEKKPKEENLEKDNNDVYCDKCHDETEDVEAVSIKEGTLNLTESWKVEYSEFLSEEEDITNEEIDLLCEDLMTAQIETSKAYSLLEQYYTVTLNELEDPRDKDKTEPTAKNINIKFDSASKGTDVSDLMRQLISLGQDTDSKAENYEPAATFTVQKISDMKFPQNIIFFIGQLIKWIRNVVVFFIEKFKNLLRRLVGAKPKELDYRALELNLTQAKKLEQISTSVDLGRGSNSVLKAYRVDKDGIGLLREGFFDSGIDYRRPEKDGPKRSMAELLGIASEKEEPVIERRVIVTIDISKDIFNLQELMQHFFDLFDNAYGSNNEKLFAADDLKLILQLFKDSIDKLKTGDLNVFSINGNAVEANTISKDAVKDNLVVTNRNINALKEAYMKTSAKIQDITKIITTKELAMLQSMGVSYQLLSSATYTQVKKLIDVLPERFKEAAKLEKDMNKVQKQYEKLVQDLQKMQRAVQSVSGVSYDVIYNRRLIELLTAANWMSQTVSLRVAGLGLYIKELKDVRDALVMLAKTNKTLDNEKGLYKY